MWIPQREFNALVAKALEDLPERFARALRNVAVVVEQEPTVEELESVGLDPQEDDLFGLYLGVPLPERGPDPPAVPDTIAVYRRPIQRACGTREEIVEEVRRTVLHELGHYFGLGEEEMPW